MHAWPELHVLYFGIDLTLWWFSLLFWAAHPTILSINNPIASEGSDSTLFCNASGFSTTVSWKNVRSKEERRGRNWIFRNITRFDDGNYTCYANNTCDSVSKSIYVNVKCKLCLYHIDVCNFSCNFFIFQDSNQKSFNWKKVLHTFFFVFNRSHKEHVSGHIQSADLMT